MKIAAALILYNPTKDLPDNLSSYYNFVDKIYVFDNSATTHAITQNLLLPKIKYFHDHKNEGIAKRLNEAATLALKEGFDWLLTMDQDSSFSRDSITRYINCANNFSGIESVAMFGTGYGRTNESGTGCNFVEADNLITSGMLLNLEAYRQIGAFDENLFIDSVDHDYVIRAKIKKYRVIRFTNIFIHHQLGQVVNRASIKTLFLIKKKKILHSPLRCYYMYRNMLYLESKFKFEDIYLAKNLRKIVTGNLLANIFYGRNTFKILQLMWKARKDFRQNKMGKISFDK